MFAATYVKDLAIAEELVQDVFIKVWEKKNELTFNDQLKSYLYTSTKNHCFNYLTKRKIEIKEQDSETLYNTKGEAPNPLENLTQKETKAKIQAGIQQLPDKCKRVFLLSRNEGMTYKEIAKFLGVSVKTVENQMGYTLKFLREYLGLKKDRSGKGYHLPSILFLLT